MSPRGIQSALLHQKLLVNLAGCLVCLIPIFLPVDSARYRDGLERGSNNASRDVHIQLTNLKLDDFTHRGSLHVDRIELRSEENDRNAFFIRNPTDPSYPLWTAPHASVTEVWPQPLHEKRKSLVGDGTPKRLPGKRGFRTFRLGPGLRIRLLGGSERCEILRHAVARFLDRAIQSVAAVSDSTDDQAPDADKIHNLEIHVRNTSFERYPHLDMQEDYELTVTTSVIQLKAQMNWGIVRGLETLGQLIFVSRRHPNVFLIHENHIVDKPAFKHRGLMIDTARHFIEKSTILENIEAMAMNKLNVFHWHIVDDQSFPYLSQKYPQLAYKSAFGGGRYFYTADDIRDVVEFARLRGIRVVAEFDTPDHTHSWGHGMPDIASWCSLDQLAYMGPLDPTNEATFKFLANLYTEVAQLFPDSWLHLGMDEVSVDCWRINATVEKFMKNNGMTRFDQLVAYYANRLSGIVENLPVKRHAIVWEDILGKDGPEYPLKLPQHTIVQIWITRDSQKVAEWRKKYRIIRSEDWYLDHSGYGADWVKRYRFKLDPSDLGGEACMWTEFQSDSSITQRIWPSVSAVAERLWSGDSASDLVFAAPRIEEQNCRMKARGIRVGVAGGPGMCQTPIASASKFDWLSGVPVMDWRHNEVYLNISSDHDYCWLYKWGSLIMALLILGCLFRRATAVASPVVSSALPSHFLKGLQQVSRQLSQRLAPRISLWLLARYERILCALLTAYCCAWLYVQM